MHYVYSDKAPVADVLGSVVVLTFDGENHPRVAAPPHIVREFCELTIRKLDAWEADQRGRVIAMREGGGHG